MPKLSFTINNATVRPSNHVPAPPPPVMYEATVKYVVEEGVTKMYIYDKDGNLLKVI